MTRQSAPQCESGQLNGQTCGNLGQICGKPVQNSKTPMICLWTTDRTIQKDNCPGLSCKTLEQAETLRKLVGQLSDDLS